MLRTLGLRVPGEAAVTHISLGRDRRNRLFLPPQPRAARATHAGRQAEVVGARSRARLTTGISLGRGLGGGKASGIHQWVPERGVCWRKLQRSSHGGGGKAGG